MQIEVEKLVYGGDGLSRVEGEVMLTPFVLPGEIAEVEREPNRSGMARGRLATLLTASPHRVTPGCPYFGRCGGCHYQHASYEEQLAAKRSILAETLGRTGKIENLPEIAIVSAEPWGYRNRIQLHFEDGQLGYRELRSHKLCPIDRCPISSPRLNECIAALTRMLRHRHWPRFLESAELFTDETDVQFNVLDSSRPLARRFFEWLAEEIPSLVPGALDYYGYRVSYGSFFQNNRFLVNPLIETVLRSASGATALDLYAGVGLFSIPLGERFASVTAVESGAARDLAFNAQRAQVNVDCRAENVDRFLAQLDAPPDFVLADPPRTGLGKIVTRRLAELRPAQITIVACDPSTLARDARELLNAGYKLHELTLVDLFPQTFHIETVAHLHLDS